MAQPRERELSHRERAFVFRSSNIFDGEGTSNPHNTTCYNPLHQKEILKEEMRKANMKFTPQLGYEAPKDVKATHNSGHNLIMGDNCGNRDKEEREVIPIVRAHARHDELPRECWRVPDSFFKNANSDNRMGWSDQRLQRARDQLPRDQQGKLSPRTGEYDHRFGAFNADVRASDLKAHEQSSEMFSHPRMLNQSPRGCSGPNSYELQSASADFLQARTDAQLREQRERNAEVHINASDRWQRNLHREHDLRPKAELREAAKMEPAEDPRRGYEKNYSDLFGEPRHCPAKIKQREEAVGTHGLSWLDSRAEIAVRNLNHHVNDGVKTAKERKNREFGNDHIIFETRNDSSPRGYADTNPQENVYRLDKADAQRHMEKQGRTPSTYGPFRGAAPYKGPVTAKTLQQKRDAKSAKSRRYQELAGAGFLNSLPDDGFAADSMERNEASHEKNAKQKTHGHQKMYYDATGGMAIGPAPNAENAGHRLVGSESRFNGSPAKMDGNDADYSTSQRKYQELKGQINHADM